MKPLSMRHIPNYLPISEASVFEEVMRWKILTGFALDTHVVSGGYSKKPYAHACKTACYLKEPHARHSPLCLIDTELD